MQNRDDRLISLETKVSYQEDLVQELNAIVISQQKSINQLDASLRLLHERMKELSTNTIGDPDSEEKPPHY